MQKPRVAVALFNAIIGRSQPTAQPRKAGE
ncbi:hypothetical protein GEM_5333 [Burkholderia cepacia GG4]|uniref:Uncharacterized protein n=1 Tax=Burkholderia cepacia GG4 TaxID=1009846 RepID=A0A9W3K677_BURCE|nr:hypothetical protein GEM_5333 [Burkholderia cepacia GG4]